MSSDLIRQDGVTQKTLDRASQLSEELVSLSVAARIAGVTRQAVTQHVERGHIDSVAMGSNRFIHLADVVKLITQYAMIGRRPKHQEATVRRDDVLKSVADRAERIVRLIIDVMRRRDVEVEKVKDRYAKKIEKATASERRTLRKERNDTINEIKENFGTRLSALHAIRQKLVR